MGAPFFSGIGCAGTEGTAVGCGVSVGLGDGVSSGLAVADGDALGLGLGDLFLRFRFVSGVGLGDGVGEIFFFFGEAIGDGLGVDFLAECFRCFRTGVGVGVASKTFLIFAPNDSSAASAAPTVPNNIATIRSARSIILEVMEFVGVSVKRRLPRRLTQTPYNPHRNG